MWEVYGSKIYYKTVKYKMPRLLLLTLYYFQLPRSVGTKATTASLPSLATSFEWPDCPRFANVLVGGRRDRMWHR